MKKNTNQNEEVLAMSMLGLNDKDEYEETLLFGIKHFYIFRRSFPSLPGGDEFANNLVTQALMKAVFSYDPSHGTAFNTHFYNKIRGEITIYIKKEESTQDYAQKLIENGDIVIKYTDDGFESDSVSKINIEDEIIAEDDYYRKRTATLMAKSELPMKLQRVLYASLEYDKIRNAADVLDLEIPELKRLRNQALALILKKVLRSKHLTDEERTEMKKDYHLI